MDINMPVLDGIQATEYLKLKYLHSELVKVIIVTAYNDTQERKLSREVGSDGFISKPFHLKSLLECLQKIKFRESSTISNLQNNE